MKEHDRRSDAPADAGGRKRAFLNTPVGFALCVFLAVGAVFLWLDRRAHVFGALPLILPLLICVGIHFFMHRGHGGYGGWRGTKSARRTRNSATATGNARRGCRRSFRASATPPAILRKRFHILERTETMKPYLKNLALAGAVLAAMLATATMWPGSVAYAQATPLPTLSEATVKALQEALNKQGIAVKADGILNDETRAAIRKYQSQHHLPVTGEPDKATLDKLGVAAAKSGEAPAAPTVPGQAQTGPGPGMMMGPGHGTMGPGQGMMGGGQPGSGGGMSPGQGMPQGTPKQ